MKFVHTADWHIGRNICGVSMLPDQRHFFQQFSAFLREERPNAVIIAGDVYDRPVPSAEAMALLDQVLSEIVLELGIPVLAISGNHDSRDRLDYERDFLAKAGLHMAGRLTAPVEQVTLSDGEGPVCFTLLPYLDAAAVNSLFPDEPRLQDAGEAFARMAREIPFDPKQRNVLVCHGYFSKAEAPPAEEDSLGGTDLVSLSGLPPFDYIAAGHIHRKMPLGPDARYSGSILQYSPREAGNTPSVTLVELGKKGDLRITERRFPPLHRLRMVEGPFDELLNAPFSEDYVFAVLTDRETVLDPVRKMKDVVFPNLMGVSYANRAELLDRRIEAPSRGASLLELFDEFYRSVTGSELSPEARKVLQEAAEAAKKEVNP